MKSNNDFSLSAEGRNVMAEYNQKSCAKCMHYKVCKILQVIGPGMNQVFPGEKPFDIHELAKICKFYTLPAVLPNKAEWMSE